MRVLTTGLLLAAILSLPDIASAQDDAAPAGRPANLCRELVAFVRDPEAAMEAARTSVQPATAVTAKASDATSIELAAPGTPQNTSGQSGPGTASGPGAAGPQEGSQNRATPAGSTATASAAALEATAPPKPAADTVRQIEGAAGSNDLPGWGTAAQTMRRAGIVMPGPFLTPAALSPMLLETAVRP